MGSLTVLSQPIMSTTEAARQLRIPPRTLSQWLEGTHRAGRWYEPILREEPTGSKDITWGEVVEARYLRAYRDERVPMQQLRPFIAALRREFGVPYPLAHSKPFIGEGKRLLAELQNLVKLPDSLRAVYEVTTGQLMLDPRVSDFLARVDFAETGEHEALRIHPHGRKSPVVMTPDIASAAATVRGVRTEVIAELADAGESAEDIAEDFGLPVNVVKAALSYEWENAA